MDPKGYIGAQRKIIAGLYLGFYGDQFEKLSHKMSASTMGLSQSPRQC